MGKPLSDRPPWEDVLVGKIRVMLVMEKSLVLEAISHHIQEHSQVGPRETPAPPAPHRPWLPGGGLATPWLSAASGARAEGQVGHKDPTTCCPDATVGAHQPGVSLDATWSHTHPASCGLGGSEDPPLPPAPTWEAPTYEGPPVIALKPAWGSRPSSSLMPVCSGPLSSVKVAELLVGRKLSWSLSSTFLPQIVWGSGAD